MHYPRLTKDETLTQVWFTGMHSNVGGGYPDNSLAGISLNWMIEEAQDCDLKFKPEVLALLRSRQDKDGRLYDSRSGLGGYSRYGPRSVEDLSSRLSDDPRDCVKIARPKIHESVFARIGVGAYSYAPVSLPQTYNIVRRNTAGRSIQSENGRAIRRPRIRRAPSTGTTARSGKAGSASGVDGRSIFLPWSPPCICCFTRSLRH